MLKLNRQILENLYYKDLKLKYPTFPYPPPPNYKDTTANGLTNCIKDFLNYQGHQAERISSGGRQIDDKKIVMDVIGRKRQIGSTKYIPGTSTNGTADISTVILGMSVKIEVKIGKDRQSEDQKKYQKSIEKAGGIYWIVKDFDGFIEQYRNLLHEGKTVHNSEKGTKFVLISERLSLVQIIDTLEIFELTASQIAKITIS